MNCVRSIFTNVTARCVRKLKRGASSQEARIEGAGRAGALLLGVGGPSKAVLEACWHWGVTHDRLEEIEGVEAFASYETFRSSFATR